jgi:hypothetical protein
MVSGSDVSFRSIEIIDKTSRKNQLKNLNYFLCHGKKNVEFNFISWPHSWDVTKILWDVFPELPSGNLT